MRIGDLSKRLGVAPSKIRFLEASGLIRSVRRLASGYRIYDEKVIERLEIILQAQSFGFTLDEIRRSFAETKEQGLHCDYLIKALTIKLQELDRHVDQIQSLRARLTNAIDELAKRRAANERVDPDKKLRGRLKATDLAYGPPVRIPHSSRRLKRFLAGRVIGGSAGDARTKPLTRRPRHAPQAFGYRSVAGTRFGFGP
jgi:DNA-binding transcriptional MerR regulator